MTNITIMISVTTTGNNPFIIFSCMPKLETLDVKLGEWAERLERFPDLPTLKSLTVSLEGVEVALDAFDHLTGLDTFSIKSFCKESIETGLAPRSIKFSGNFEVLKLTSAAVYKYRR
jgi:hypothetical protein